MLRNGLGGPELQEEQLRHLLSVGSLPSVSLGVVPTRTGRSRMPVEGFWIFDTSQVNVELVSVYLTLTQPTAVAAYGAPSRKWPAWPSTGRRLAR
ncbi:Scr1 family TA system antitoxin-like transcriptional regulator [Streptomyces sp. NPDC006670]|uniref:Scr1 family TA system antitoxin-like transcriptional regulator n=1 Tax=Streptomyces sp. NPDC006670 TaxID=3154476 RepID=UPI0033F8E323